MGTLRIKGLEKGTEVKDQDAKSDFLYKIWTTFTSLHTYSQEKVFQSWSQILFRHPIYIPHSSSIHNSNIKGKILQLVLNPCRESFCFERMFYWLFFFSEKVQIEDPRLQWRALQEDMLRSYLVTAQEDLTSKKELVNIKQARLSLAQDEFTHLNTTLSALSNSTTSCK